MPGPLVALARRAFEADDGLPALFPGFQSRPGQTSMAVAVAETAEQGGALVVEAPTGVGKTYAYLVPALLSGKRVLLSTATKALQDQLYQRDLPRLTQALGLPIRVTLLKGRSSYLCQRRLELALQNPELQQASMRDRLHAVQRWARSTETGDLAELPWLDERSPLIPMITSTRENCLGADCPFFKTCHVNAARRRAMAADVVVINHHLFFADLAIRESGVAELLPAADIVVFDEAHRINDIGIQFLGRQLSSGQLLNLARDAQIAGLAHAPGLQAWRECCAALESAARNWRLLFASRGVQRRIKWIQSSPEGVDAQAWSSALETCRSALATLGQACQAVLEVNPEFARLDERVQLLLAEIERFAQAADPGKVRWVNVGSLLRLVESPLDISDVVQSRLLNAEPASGSLRALIFVSATLGTDDDLSWFTHASGLQSARVMRVDSPFDYGRQAWLYIPRPFAHPGTVQHSQQVADLATEAARTLGGRTLVLTTTLRALKTIGDCLDASLAAENPSLQVLVQGRQAKRVLVDRFRNESGGNGCILVASASFWEGFDVPGDALQVVIIDKLPFPPPDDPLVDARCQRIRGEGGSPFADYSLPATAIALKQGAGRLIRAEGDFGGLVVCDPRLLDKPYGRRLIKALPTMPRLQDHVEFERALSRLKAVASATD